MQYRKQYYNDHTDQIKQRNRQQYPENKEQIIEQNSRLWAEVPVTIRI